VILKGIQRDLSKAQVTDIEKDFPMGFWTEMLWVSSKVDMDRDCIRRDNVHHTTNKQNYVLPCPLLLVLLLEN